MTISIHQPNFIPWLGYFYKIHKSDIFIFLDNVQYTKNSYINRNKIKTVTGGSWLTMPVKAGKLNQFIMDTEYFEIEKNVKKVIKTIEINYSKAKYFHLYFDSFCNHLNTNSQTVSTVNISIICWLLDIFGIDTTIKLASNIETIDGIGTERLISICKLIGGDIYLSGSGGANYQESVLFENAGIELIYSDFIHPKYEQLYGQFIPNLSAIDFLFNNGSACKEFFK